LHRGESLKSRNANIRETASSTLGLYTDCHYSGFACIFLSLQANVGTEAWITMSDTF
jgi:hypothetical protein